MRKTPSSHQVVTAALTVCGSPVYLRSDREWTHRLEQADPIADPELARNLVQWASTQEQQVCDAYAVGVNLDERGAPVPLSQRERIRASGPTIASPPRRVA